MPAEGAKQIKEVKGLLYTTEYEFRPGRIRIEGDRIAEVDFCTKGELSEAERGMLVLPGLVDIHFHGAAGYDFCDGTQEAYRAIEAYENSHGITSICPATMTLPVEQLKQILTEVSEDKPDSLVGVHLEGPFINKAKKGAQKEEYVDDMIEAGIVDPTKVTRSALENASSVAAMVLTTESLVADLPEPPAPAAPAGGDMGGMY